MPSSGITIVLNDVQMIDFRGPVPKLFVDHQFRSFLRERPDFLALVAEPARSAKDVSFGVALKGIERLTNQANKPKDSFEMAVTHLGEPLLHARSFDLDRYVASLNRRTGHVGRVIRRFPQYRRELVGLMHAVGHFAESPLPTTTTASSGASGRYDTLLANVQTDHRIMSLRRHAFRTYYGYSKSACRASSMDAGRQ